MSGIFLISSVDIGTQCRQSWLLIKPAFHLYMKSIENTVVNTFQIAYQALGSLTVAAPPGGRHNSGIRPCGRNADAFPSVSCPSVCSLPLTDVHKRKSYYTMIRTLSNEELEYLRSQQSKADALVSDPESDFYEPDESKRRTAARVLMRKWEEERANSPIPLSLQTPK